MGPKQEIEVKPVILDQVHYSLKEACKLKAVNYASILNKPWLKPNAGIEDYMIGGRQKWSANTIKIWLNQSDDELLSIYKERQDGGCKDE